MNRRHTSKDYNHGTHSELSRKTAIHEAGHAAAIYFGNKHKQLPPVFFQIVIKSSQFDNLVSESAYKCCDDNFLAKIEGGRLIQNLPSSFEDASDGFSCLQKLGFKQALEADIINFIVGPLAEANYIALRDDEVINPCLVNLQALYNYGGASDIETIEEYLDCFVLDVWQREKKINELFLAAYNFIVNPVHWRGINALAECILMGSRDIMEYQEIATVLDCQFANSQTIAY